jgi:ABC-2 type transport system permease protein
MSLLLCFITYVGFDFISSSGLFGKYDAFVKGLGMNEHYISMSRGVIDTRDVVYFLSLISIFNLLSNLVLKSRKW